MRIVGTSENNLRDYSSKVRLLFLETQRKGHVAKSVNPSSPSNDFVWPHLLVGDAMGLKCRSKRALAISLYSNPGNVWGDPNESFEAEVTLVWSLDAIEDRR